MSPSLDTLPLSEEARRSLSWDFLWFATNGLRTDVAHDPLGALVRAALDTTITDDELRAVAKSECDEGRSLARIRAQYSRDDERPRLSASEEEAFLLAVSGAGEHDVKRTRWELLVRAGMTPADALDALKRWTRASAVFPTGQIISEEAMAAAMRKGPESYNLPSGRTITADEAREVFEDIDRGNKIGAIKRLRELTGAGLGESKADMDSMADRGGAWSISTVENSPRDVSNARARIALDAAIESLLIERPFHWAVLAAATIVEDFTHATMAVGLTRRHDLLLFYNPEFVLGLSLTERMAVLTHEVNHVIFGHLTPPPETAQARDAWVLACEATANEFVPWTLPGTPFTCESLGLPSMQWTVTRYHTLRARSDLPKVAERDFVMAALRRGATHHGDVEASAGTYPWSLVRAAAELVGEEIDADTLGSFGAAGPAIEDVLDPLLRPEGVASLPWETLLKQLAVSLTARRATLRWPSRRAPERVGVVPGRRAQRERPVVLVAIDTSASMSETELSQIATEVSGMTARELRVACVQCDTEVRDTRWLASGDTIRRAVGRGGTDLRPPFSAEVLRRYDPDAVVYFTDGEGPTPNAAPAGVEVLWVLTGPAPRVPARWGRVVCLRPRSQRERVRSPG